MFKPASSVLVMNVLAASAVLAVFAGAGCEEKKAPAAKPAGAGSPATAPDGKTPDPMKEVADKTKEMKETAAKTVEEAKKTVTEAPKEAAKKVTEVTQAAKDAMKGYLSQLGDVNGLLEKITGPLNAAPSLGKLSELASGLNANSTLLNALPADQKAALAGENKSSLESLTSAFKAQVERLTKDSSLGGIVGETLKKFKLFE